MDRRVMAKDFFHKIQEKIDPKDFFGRNAGKVGLNNLNLISSMAYKVPYIFVCM